MGNVKRHKSPKTGKWEKCRTDRCPYGDISGEAFKTLKPVITVAQVPVAAHLHLSVIDYPADGLNRYRGKGTYEVVRAPKELRVAPKGYTGASCDSCGSYLPEGYMVAAQPPRDYGFYTGLKSVPCPNPKCAEQVSPVYHRDLGVAATDAKYFTDDVAVRRAHWFHVTTRENWLEDATESGPNGEAALVHVGSRAAALDRLRTLDREGSETYYLYEVEVDAATPINPHVMDDAIDTGQPTRSPHTRRQPVSRPQR
jgi:hypothetical protein